MKKKLVFSLLGFFVMTIGLILLWPLSFANVITNDTEMLVVVIDLGIEHGSPIQNSTDYRFQPDSKEFMQIQQILSKYSFHRSFRSFFNDTSLNGNNPGYWLQLYSGEKNIISGGTGEITVNNHVYRIGYWGNKTALTMMNDIRSALERK